VAQAVAADLVAPRNQILKLALSQVRLPEEDVALIDLKKREESGFGRPIPPRHLGLQDADGAIGVQGAIVKNPELTGTGKSSNVRTTGDLPAGISMVPSTISLTVVG